MHIAVFFREVALAEDDTGGVQLQGLLQHIGLLTADDDAAGLHALEDISRRGQGDHDLAGNLVEHVLRVIDDPALQGAQQVKDGHIRDLRMLHGVHVALRNAARGNHAI